MIQHATDQSPVTREPQETPTRLPQPLLTPKDFYNAMGTAIGLNTIYELIRAGRIRSVKLGRKILIPHTEVHAFPEREANRHN